jgi:Predicted lipoprotein of unknown function (DUF2380)
VGLDATGVGGAVSWAPDLLNVGISLVRGDFTGAGLSTLAAVPFIGAAANAARVGRAAKATEKLHHLLPQAQRFRKFFERAGLDIEDFKIPLDRTRHRLNPGGIHTNSGGNWNRVWDDFFEATPNATRDQILRQLDRMRADFGI